MLTEDTIRKWHREADQALNRALVDQAQRTGTVPPCRKGCHWCCYEAVTADAGEAKLAIDALEAWGDGDIHDERPWLIVMRILRIAPAAAAWAEKHGISHYSDSNTGLSYRKLHLACPFLDLETRLCLIYEIRPFSCRVHTAMKASRFCRDLEVRDQQEFLNSDWITWLMLEARDGVPQDIRDAKEELGLWPVLLKEELQRRLSTTTPGPAAAAESS